MLVSCWSTKGGAGTSVVAAALAVLLARPRRPGRRRLAPVALAERDDSPATGSLLVDLTGDAATVLGHGGDPTGPGVAAWLAAAPDVPPDALGRLEVPLGHGLAALLRGSGPLDPRAADVLAGVLNADPRPVVADCGTLGRADEGGATVAQAAVAAGATRSLLVLRPCFLALRRAVAAPLRASGVVLVAEQGRAITPEVVEDTLDVPVVARVRVTEQVARAVDAGLLAARLPRSLADDLCHAA